MNLACRIRRPVSRGFSPLINRLGDSCGGSPLVSGGDASSSTLISSQHSRRYIPGGFDSCCRRVKLANVGSSFRRFPNPSVGVNKTRISNFDSFRGASVDMESLPSCWIPHWALFFSSSLSDSGSKDLLMKAYLPVFGQSPRVSRYNLRAM